MAGIARDPRGAISSTTVTSAFVSWRVRWLHSEAKLTANLTATGLHTLTATWRPFWLSCWSDFHFDWLDHPSWPDPAGIDLAFRWDRSRTHSPETTHTLGKHKPAETPPRGLGRLLKTARQVLATTSDRPQTEEGAALTAH